MVTWDFLLFVLFKRQMKHRFLEYYLFDYKESIYGIYSSKFLFVVLCFSSIIMNFNLKTWTVSHTSGRVTFVKSNVICNKQSNNCKRDAQSELKSCNDDEEVLIKKSWHFAKNCSLMTCFYLVFYHREFCNTTD